MSKKFKHLKKNKKGFKRDVLHLFDHLFYEVYSKEQYILDLFRLVLTSEEFELFDWSTLQSRVTVFIDKAFRERRADVIFSVKLKTGQMVEIIFLFEHKSYNDPSVFIQMLNYQCDAINIYEKDSRQGKNKVPSLVIPVLVYSGKEPWKMPLSFHGYLNFPSLKVQAAFKENILNYKYRLLNLHDLGIEILKSKSLIFVSLKINWLLATFG